MNQVATQAVVLTRLNYGEADKIITLLTPNNGKIRVIARGVRKIKSKLAGGIELFSVTSIVYIPGKKDICTLVSTRLMVHYSHIVEDIDRTMLGYDILKYINKATQDECEQEYYLMLVKVLASLDDVSITPMLTKCWYMARLLQLLGHTPNVRKDTAGNVFDSNKRYQFDYQDMGFYQHTNGVFMPNHIKLLRILLTEDPAKLHVIKDLDNLLPDLELLLRQTLESYIR